jgi:predicted nuclease of predicted toxin-antitoxin system
VKLLLDENLSPQVAEALRGEGIDAVHVRDRGLLQATDREVLDRAFDEDRVLVTANVGDFLKLARARDLHAGIVLIENGGLLRDEQREVVVRAHEAMRGQRDMANRVLRIAMDLTMTFEEVPPDPAG